MTHEGQDVFKEHTVGHLRRSIYNALRPGFSSRNFGCGVAIWYRIPNRYNWP